MVIPLAYLRIFVDDTGRSHFEECTLPLQTRDFAPPTTPLEVSELIPADGFAALRFAPGWSGPWHPSPYRQWIFLLSGSITVTVGDGTERTLAAGDIVLLEDMGTRGHLTRVNGTQQAIAVGVEASQ